MSETDRKATLPKSRGYFGVGIENTKTHQNVGSLWRTADLMGAAFMFTIGKRYQRQASDTMKSHRHIPLFAFADLDDLWAHIPLSCPVVGVELDERAHMLGEYTHPERAIYLLGAEDHGLTKRALDRCHDLVQLPGRASMNVSVAGSIVLYDRLAKAGAA